MRRNPSSPLTLLAALAAISVPAHLLGQGHLREPTRTQFEQPSTSTSEATEGADFLLLPTGARAAALGGAVTALRGSGDAPLWSPAGLAALKGRRLLFNHSEGAFDTRSDVVAVLWPTESLGTLGFTYFLVDFGNLENTGPEGRVQGQISFRNQEFLLSWAARLVGNLEVGVNYKLIQLVFRCDGRCPEQPSFTRSTHAVDLGAIYHEPLGLPIALGGSIRHLGFALDGASEDDPLPTRVRLGLSYEVLRPFTRDRTFGLALAVDVEDRWRDFGHTDVLIGSEFSVASQFFLRAGYSFVETGTGGPTLGLGVVQDWFYVDLSRGFDEVSNALGDESLQVTFGLIF